MTAKSDYAGWCSIRHGFATMERRAAYAHSSLGTGCYYCGQY